MYTRNVQKLLNEREPKLHQKRLIRQLFGKLNCLHNKMGVHRLIHLFLFFFFLKIVRFPEFKVMDLTVREVGYRWSARPIVFVGNSFCKFCFARQTHAHTTGSRGIFSFFTVFHAFSRNPPTCNSAITEWGGGGTNNLKTYLRLACTGRRRRRA